MFILSNNFKELYKLFSRSSGLKVLMPLLLYPHLVLIIIFFLYFDKSLSTFPLLYDGAVSKIFNFFSIANSIVSELPFYLSA